MSFSRCQQLDNQARGMGKAGVADELPCGAGRMFLIWLIFSAVIAPLL